MLKCFAETAREIAANSSCEIRMHHLNKNEFKFNPWGKRDEWCRRLTCCKVMPSSGPAVATVGAHLMQDNAYA